MEVAPPQFVTVMRHRTRKMLDTINEEDRDGSNDDNSLSPTLKSSPTAIPVSATMVAAAAAASSSSATTVMPSSKYLSKERQVFQFSRLEMTSKMYIPTESGGLA
ncbi:uncharacterized protein [Gossypium hirsutum]|uniref:Uncharacterized protein n=1 Tax=Gossypium hirsutum TaxID=3635 RepID=A0ABM3A9J3_GOSHI|nr:uncharacterized protein LOC107901873 [Gossypium hirsutum]